MRRQSTLFWVGIGLVLVIVALLTGGGRRQEGPPLDPSSTTPTGTRALVLLWEELGADVGRGLPDNGSDVAVVLADRLDAEQRDDLVDWVVDGGTLVVADTGSELTAPPASLADRGLPVTAVASPLGSGTCDLPDLVGLTLEGAPLLRYGDLDGQQGIVSCFGDGSSAHLAAWSSGDGQVVVVGGASALTNEWLGTADNAALAGWLVFDGPAALADRLGTGASNQAGNVESPSVALLYDPVFSPGSRSLLDLIPTAAKWAWWQFLVAFGLYVAWRARRFGRPVAEPQPVELPGSLLVRASGELHRRSRGYDRAGRALRTNLVDRLRTRFRIPADVPVGSLVDLTAVNDPAVDERAVRDEMERVLSGPEPATGGDLTALVGAIDRIEAALLPEEASAEAPEPEPDAETTHQPVGDTT